MNSSILRRSARLVLNVLLIVTALLAVAPADLAAQSAAPAGRPPGAAEGAVPVLFNGHAVVPGQYLARLKAKVPRDPQSIEAMAARLPSTVGIERVESLRSSRLTLLRPTAQASARLQGLPARSRQGRIETDVADLLATGLYDYVEPDYIQYAAALPTDAAFADGRLWGLRNTGQNGGMSGADINAVAAWNLTTGSNAVVVGVIDSGIRYTHQDLASQMWTNPGEIAGDGLDNDSNGYVDDIHGVNAITGTGDPMDDNSHGTHCAGTIGASANDAGPLVGVAWNVRLMGLKFLNAGGSGDTSNAIKCIEYALSKGVRILSNSWGGGGPSQALEDAIRAARDQGCLFLAAAGNAGMDADRTSFFPASYDVDNIVSVGALDRRDELAGFTNTGLSAVDLAAPGVDIYSSVASNDTAYASFNGTSMATPHVAGVAALVLARHPGIGVTELRDRLIASTREVASLRAYAWSGGAVDAYRALTIAADGALDVRSSAAVLPLRAGYQESLFVTVTDLAPVLGAVVAGRVDGGAPVAFLDNGVAPDRVAGDGVYSAYATIPAGVTEVDLDLTATKAGKTSFSGSCSYPVGVAPANDHLAAATPVPPGGGTVTGSNVNAGIEVGEPVHAYLGTGRSVWWSWTAPAGGVAVVDLDGTAFFPAVGIYTGHSVAALTPVGTNGDGSGYLRRAATFVATAGTTYRIAVDGIGRSAGSIAVGFPTSLVPLPTNDHFAAATLLAGANGRATGTNHTATRETGEPDHAGNPGVGSVWWTWTAPANGTYRWSTAGSTFDTLLAVYTGGAVATLTEVASNDESPNIGDNTSELSFAATAGTTYRIAVDGWNGARGVVQLAFEAVAPPPNDNFADAIALTGAAGSTTGTNRHATGEAGEPIHVNSHATATSVWYAWTATTDGYEQFDTDGSAFDTALAVYTGNAVGSLTPLRSDDNSGDGTCSRVVVPVVAGTTYRIAVGDANFSTSGGALVVNYRAYQAPTILSGPADAQAEIGGKVEFSVTATGTDLNYQWYHDGVALAGVTAPTLALVNLQREDAGDYHVVVSNEAGHLATPAAMLSGPNPAPTVQPVAATATAVSGSGAQFAVVASGKGTLAYQWRRFGAALPGATGATLELSPVAMADAGLYDVAVYDGLSRTLSGATRLFVAPVGGYASNLRLDPHFAPFVEAEWAAVEGLAVAPGGALYAVGDFSTIAGVRRSGLAKFDAATLTLDPGFAPRLDGTAYAVAVQADGKVVVGGAFATVDGAERPRLARFAADGSLDATFAAAFGTNDIIRAIAVQADGKILVGGDFWSVGGVSRQVVARLNPDGSLDETFGAVTGPNGTVHSIVVQADGRVLIGGWFTTVDNQSANRIARLNADGSLDGTFAVGSGFSDGPVRTIVAEPNGRVLVGGQFTAYDGTTANRLVRLNADGSRDLSFATGTGFDGEVRAVTVLADGRIAASGWFNSFNGAYHYGLAVLSPTGVLDAGYASGARPNGPGYALVARPDGGLLEAGYFTAHGATGCSGLVRFTGTGTLAAAAAAGFRQPGRVFAAAPVAGGKWLVGGSFSRIDGVACSNLARLNVDGSVDLAFAAAGGPDGQVAALAVQGDGKIVAGGAFNWCQGAQRRFVARFDADGALDAGFDPGPGLDGIVTVLTLQGDGKVLLGGWFTSIAGVSRSRLARLQSDGSLDPSFDPGAGLDGDPRTIVAGPDGRIVVAGNFTSFAGSPAGYIVGLLPNGARDGAFVSGGFSSAVEALVPSADGGLLAAGSFWSFNGTWCPPVMRLSADGARDPMFTGSVAPNSTPLLALTAQIDGGALVGGFFTNCAGVEKRYLARLRSDGALDASFTAFDLFGPVLQEVHYMDDGGLLVLDSSAARGPVTCRGLLRLKPEASPAPAITAQPADQFVGLGDTASFTVVATGDDLQFQWYRDGVALPGATGATWTIPSAGLSDIGSYTVRVWNRWGSRVSEPVVLSGNDPMPTITTPPGVVVAESGTAATFAVEASGPNGIAFQWRRAGVPIPGATGATLTLPAVAMADAGFYDVVVYHGLTPQASQAGRLMVKPAGGYADTLRLDPTFAPLFESEWAAINALSGGADGAVYAVGNFSTIAGVRRAGVAKFDATLGLDPAYAPRVTGEVRTAVVDATGGLVIGGSFSAVDGVERMGLARLLPDGSLDPAFVPAVRGTVFAVLLLDDGRLLVGGSQVVIASNTWAPLVRLNADGSLDPTFANEGWIDSDVMALAVQSDGRILLGGNFSSIGGQSRNRLARLNADGSLDESFVVGTGFAGGSVRTIAVQTDGRVLAGGWFTSFDGTAANRLVRLNANGSLDPSFALGSGFDGDVCAVAVLAGGRVAVTGWFNATNVVGRYGVAVLSAEGVLDTGFAATSRLNGAGYTLLALPDGGLLEGGNFTSVGSTGCSGLVRYTGTGAVAAAAAAGFRQLGTVHAAVPAAGGKWVIGGNFSRVDGVACSNLVRLDATGAVDPTFASAAGPGGSVEALAVQGDGKVLAGGWFYSSNGLSRQFLARYLADGSLDPSFDPGTGFNSAVTILALQADGKVLVGGQFTLCAGEPRNRIARLETDGSLDTTFDPGAGLDQQPRAIVVGPDGRIVVAGYFTSFDDAPVNYLVGLLPDGSRDTAFASGGGFSSYAERLALAVDGTVLAAGSFWTYDNVWCLPVVRLSANGALDSTFATGSGPNSTPLLALVPLADGGALVGGHFTTYGGLEKRYLARLQPDGSVASAFTAFDLSGPVYRGAQLMDDGGLLLLQASGAREGVGCSGLVRLKPDVSPAPTITAQPADQFVGLGGTALFTVTATGDDLEYQWYRDGAALPGATGNALAVPNVGLSDVGSYTVRVWNRWGSRLSAGAVLAGNDPAPILTTPPGVVVAESGTAATFKVAVTGTSTLSYQWRRLGTPIAGATGATLTLPAVAMADAGLYDVVVYNGLTPLASPTGRLMVKPAGGYADTLRLDPSFAPLIEVDGGSVDGLAVASGGTVYSAGQFTTIAGQRRFGVAKFDSSLALDPGFAPQFDGSINAVAVQADGKVLVGGAFALVNGVARQSLARLAADGSLDATFTSGFGSYDWIYDIAVQPDGRILVAGIFGTAGGAAHPMAVRLHADGSLDSSFHAGIGPDGAVVAVVLQPDGKVLVVGSFTSVEGHNRNGLARLNSDGALDGAFAVGSGFPGWSVQSIDIQSDGRILVSGTFTEFNGTPVNRLVRLNADGTRDLSFVMGAGFDGGVRAVAVLADSRIAATGWFSSYDGTPQFGIAVLGATGGLDSAFASTARPNGGGAVLVALPDGGCLEGGSFNTVGSTGCSGLVRFSAAGNVGASTAADFRRPGSVLAAAPVTGGKWVIGGYFSRIDGVACSNLARLNADGAVDPSFASAAGPNGTVEALAVQGDGKVLAGGGFSWSHGVQRPHIARYLVDGSLDLTFDPGVGANGGIGTLALQADGKVLIGGWFTSVNGVARNRIARLETHGAVDVSFDPGAGLDGVPDAIVLGPDGRIVAGGDFHAFDGVSANYIVGLLPNGTRDPAFASGSGFSNDVDSLAVSVDGSLLAAGFFTAYDGGTCRGVARLSTNGALDPAFNTGMGPGWSWLPALVPQADGRTLVGGEFKTFDSVPQRYLARLRANGSLDTAFTAFDLHGPVSGEVGYTDDGSLLVLSSSAARGGVVRHGMVRLRPDVPPAAPTILGQPQSAAVAFAASATLRVVAAGDGVLSYQWYRGERGDTTAPISGATAATYATPPLMAWGRYWVRVSLGGQAYVDSAMALVQVAGGTMTLADWTALPGTPAGRRGALDTPAGDGVSNLMKFALGVPPMDAVGGHFPTAVVRTVAGQPQTLGVLFAKNPGAQGIAMSLEVSPDLANWTVVPSVEETVAANPDGTVLVRLWEASPPSAPRRFARLRVDVIE